MPLIRVSGSWGASNEVGRAARWSEMIGRSGKIVINFGHDLCTGTGTKMEGEGDTLDV